MNEFLRWYGRSPCRASASYMFEMEKTLRGIKTSSCPYVIYRVPCGLQYLKTRPKSVLCWGKREGRARERIPGPPELSQVPSLHYPLSGFCRLYAVPRSFEKSGRCPCSFLSSCFAPSYLGQKIMMCFAACSPLPQLWSGECTERTLAWKMKHLGHLFPFSAVWPASSLSSWAPHGASRHLSPEGPQPNWG